MTDDLRRAGRGAAAVDLLRPVAADLDALHDRGVLHRAVTPAAVVVDGAGHGRLSPPPEAVPGDVAATATGGAGDGAVYHAPEQAAGPVASHRTDLWGFACVAYEAVAGTPAFTVGTLGALVAGSPPPIGDGPVDDVFRRAFAVRPTDRPGSAAELVDALAAAFGGRYRPAAGPGLRRLMWTSCAVALVTASAAVTVLVAGGGPEATSAPRPPAVSGP